MIFLFLIRYKLHKKKMKMIDIDYSDPEALKTKIENLKEQLESSEIYFEELNFKIENLKKEIDELKKLKNHT